MRNIVDSSQTAVGSEKMQGFTLVELIVSVGIFAMVMLIATSAYFSLIALDRRARATNQIVSSLSFAVDAMSRGMRTGADFQCNNGSADAYGNYIAGDCTSFSYTDSVLGTTVTYIKKVDGSIGRCQGSGSCLDANASPLTDPAITIQKLSFYVRGVGTGASPSWAQQPHVTFVISGELPGGKAGEKVPFTLEGGATQRLTEY